MPSEQDKNDLRRQAWEIRQRQDSRIWFSAPGSKHYESRSFKNQPYSFANLSVTGSACDCRCEHCNARLLQTMLPAETPAKLRDTVDRLIEHGCRGILVSGGADGRGEVPLDPFMEAIRYARKRGLNVLVHSGLIQKETALKLKDCDVNQVMMDVIGHEQTIREVYHLDRAPEDYLQSMMICREVGLDLAPHVVIGLHFGRILGEYEALRMIQCARPNTLVMVVLTPTAQTGMQAVNPPGLADVEDVLASARVWNPDVFLSLGCAKTQGPYKRQLEISAIDCGVNGVAFPADEAVEHAKRRGLQPVFTEECCSMAGRKRD